MDKKPGQFVIHRHTTASGIHWDLMLEAGGVLWTWRLSVPPDQIGTTPVYAEQIADHSHRFLTYEGPVQKNTGQVQRADAGEYLLLDRSVQTLLFELNGSILSGRFELIRQDQNQWILRRPILMEGL